jgi:hypothetical protein
MQIHGGVGQIGMTEQQLNGSQIRAGFQQMGRVGVPPIPQGK